jgi:SAM-dependent methyltransferase
MLKVAREGARWEEIARQDPMWAILAYPEGKYGHWSEERFFRTGVERVDQFLTHAAALSRPLGREAALDFGSGLGRLTRALAARFDHVIGVDISETMVENARELNVRVTNCSFVCNARADLRMFEDASFDLVVSDVVLQHVPDRNAAEAYLAEFVRVLRPGGLLVFQLPTSLPLSVRIQPRRTAYRVMRRLGLPAQTLYWRLGLHPNRMLAIPSSRVTSVLDARGATVLDAVSEQSSGIAVFEQSVYYATR